MDTDKSLSHTPAPLPSHSYLSAAPFLFLVFISFLPAFFVTLRCYPCLLRSSFPFLPSVISLFYHRLHSLYHCSATLSSFLPSLFQYLPPLPFSSFTSPILSHPLPSFPSISHFLPFINHCPSGLLASANHCLASASPTDQDAVRCHYSLLCVDVRCCHPIVLQDIKNIQRYKKYA